MLNSVELSGFNTNYHINRTNEGKLTVNKRPVELAWAGHEELIYNGRQQIPSVSITNIVYNDDVEAIVTYNDLTSPTPTGVNAGNHSVYVEANSGLEGSRSSNYILSTRNTLPYEIARRSIQFDGNNFTLTYGQDPDTTNTYSYSLNANYEIYTKN